MEDILFSIITVTYNSEKTVRDTLESVLNQTYQNFEYIIVDGKSTDATLDILNEYVDKFGDRLKIVSESDAGIYDAMNKGINMANGDVIGIINSDDWYENITLEKVKEQYVQDSYTIYHGYMRTIDNSNGKEIRCAIYNPDYIREAMINHPTMFVNKCVYEDYGAYDCKYKKSADYDFVIRMSQKENIQFIAINEILANFRTGGASESIDALMETMKIKKKYNMMNLCQYVASMIYLQARKFLGYYTI